MTATITETGPALVHGLVVVPVPNGLLIEGGATRRMFRGKAATEVLPRLLPLLDGRGLDEVARECGLSPGLVAQAVALLDKSGLIEHGTGRPPAGPVETFLSRTVAYTRRHRNAGSVTRSLASAVVAVVAEADDPAGPAIAADLAAMGVGTVIPAERVDDALLARLADAPARLVVWSSAADQTGRLRAAGIDVLRYAMTESTVEIGPAFTAETACTTCFHQGRTAAGWSGPGAPGPGLADLAAGLVGAEVVALLTRVTWPATVRAVVRLSAPDLRSEHFDVVPERDCEVCYTVDGGELAGAYDWLSRRPAGLARVGDGSDAGKLRDLAASPRLPVDEALPADLARAVTAAGSDGGVDMYVLRAAGLPYAVYRVDAATSELVATRADLPGPGTSPQGLPPGAEAVVVLVAAPGRMFRPRGADSYRQSHLRAGAALARITAAATGTLRVVLASGSDPGLAELLELSAGHEMPAAVAGLYRIGDERAALR